MRVQCESREGAVAYPEFFFEGDRFMKKKYQLMYIKLKIEFYKKIHTIKFREGCTPHT